jgi:hypothetical protein
MMFVHAFGSGPKKSLRTFARAYLLIAAISLVLGVLMYIVIFAVSGIALYGIAEILNELADSYYW